jgi:protein TonB
MPSISNAVSSPDTRAFGTWLALSIAVHAAIVLALPGVRLIDRTQPEVLQVTFKQTEPPKVLPPAPEVAKPLPPQPVQKKPSPPRALPRAMTPPKPETREVPPAPPREAPPVPAPVLTAPQADVPLRSAPAETDITPRQDTARAAPPTPKAAPVPRESAAAATPPNYNAAYLRNPPPRYPVSARRNGEQGTVTLRVFVSREGLPLDVTVHTTSGSGSLDQAALEAVKRWRFVPARQGSEPVEAWVLVPIVYKLDGVS